MRILWVRRQSSDEGAGDSLYDGKLIRGLTARGHEIVEHGLARNSRPRQFLRAALRFSLPEQYAVGDDADVARVRDMLRSGGFDAAVFSHEHVDAFARAVRPGSPVPFVSLRHNITSDLMDSLLAGMGPLRPLYRTLAQRQERSALRRPLFAAVSAVSVRDRRLLTALTGRQDIALVQPGAPPESPLNADAAPARELVISGTFDWYPKARDLRRFVREYAAAAPKQTPVRCAPSVPSALRAELGATEDDNFDAANAIRFGVITDRFSAGHKLKTAAYLMKNCAVISFAKVLEDFADLPFAKTWIVEVASVAELAEAMDRLAARPAGDLRAELTALKNAVAERLAWSRQAEVLEGVIAAAMRSSASR